MGMSVVKNGGLGSGMNSVRCVLIVDDEAGVLDIGRKILSDYGFEVKLAASGMEAIALCRAEHAAIGLVILDIGLQDMSGLECLGALKTGCPDLKVAICTGSEDFSSDDAERLGACGFISKPYRMKDLLEFVEKIFHG